MTSPETIVNVTQLNEIIDKSITAWKTLVINVDKLKSATENLPPMTSMSRLLFLCLESSSAVDENKKNELKIFMKNNIIAYAEKLTTDTLDKLLTDNPSTVFKKISFTNEYTGYFNVADTHNFIIQNVFMSSDSNGEVVKHPVYTLIENNNFLYVKYIVSAAITFTLNSIELTSIIAFLMEFKKDTENDVIHQNIIRLLNTCETSIVTAKIKRYLLDTTDKRFESICNILMNHDTLTESEICKKIYGAYTNNKNDQGGGNSEHTYNDDFEPEEEDPNMAGGAIDISSLSPRTHIKMNRPVYPKMKNRKKSYKLVKHIRTRKVNVRN